MTKPKPKYASLEDVPKYNRYGSKRYPIPQKKRLEMYLKSRKAEIER